MRSPSPIAVPGVFLAAVLTGSLLAGCGGDDPAAAPAATGASTTSAASTTSETSTPAAPPDEDGGPAAPSSPADTSPDTQDASPGAAVTVTDVRLGHHDGFDRVVLEVHGTGTPGWGVRDVDVAGSQGRGEPLKGAGGRTLQGPTTAPGNPSKTGGTGS